MEKKRKNKSNLYKSIRNSETARIEKTIKQNTRAFFTAFLSLSDTFSFSQKELETISEAIDKTITPAYIYRMLHSKKADNRKFAAHIISKLPLRLSEPVLLQALASEPLYSVKIVIVNALVERGNHSSIPDIIDSLVGAPEEYCEKVISLTADLGPDLIHYLPVLEKRSEKEVRYFLIRYGKICGSVPLFNYLMEQTESGDQDLARLAFEALLENYTQRLPLPLFLSHPDLVIRRKALEVLGETGPPEEKHKLLKFLKDQELHDSAVIALTSRIRNHPETAETLLQNAINEENREIRRGIAEIFSNRMEYFLYRILSPNQKVIKNLIKIVLYQGYTSGIISFLNRNHDIERENEILDTLRKILSGNKKTSLDFQLYLKPEILEKLNIPTIEETTASSARHEGVPKFLLGVFIVLSFLVYPVIFILDLNPEINAGNLISILRPFLIKANYYFAYYSFAVNGSYLILLLLSFIGIFVYNRKRESKPGSFIFKKGILPSISIIAPAYGEEATIIESVTALLNLDYPEYEVLVVNDGSKDRTLEKLLNHFDLERVDFFYKQRLKTNSIRGIYRNKSYPNLTVIDKTNGGKADSLNAGINVARGDYCCGIDADSLLEGSALREAAATILDSEKKTVALGGMILPVNGCSVQRGQIEEFHISRKLLPGFQTVEYIRAFISGRIGWSVMKSLLIISGAFGLFSRKELLEIHGYLTSREYLGRDTVGEDMELVVRMVEKLKQTGRGFSVIYNPFALCWTEVPDTIKILSSQRRRWQRGLLDILFIHKKMIANPSYGPHGTLALPYFLVFEAFGPWLELQGYIYFFTSLILGLLNINIIFLVLTAAIFFGIFISLCSLILLDRVHPGFSNRDLLRLVFLALIENLGFRQLMSFTRITGTLELFKRKQGWGKMVRKGFSNTGGKE